jgi:methylated-DNA-[protein]-cysteine S-methyltransferase
VGLRFQITRLQLPEDAPEHTEERIAKSCRAAGRSAAPDTIAEVTSRIARHLHGELQDFRDVAVDLSAVPSLAVRIYELTRQIPAGLTITYGELAAKLGSANLARAVGRVLGKNPIPVIIPCHRILAAHGKPGGFSAYGGRATKARLLALEGAQVNLCLELGEG